VSKRPVGRSRRRYISVKIDSEKTFDERDFYDAVWASVFRLFGEYGASQTELVLVEYDLKKRQAILRCSHKVLDMVKASLVAVTDVKDEKATIHILLVSGTLKSLRRKLQNRKTPVTQF